MGKRKGPWRVLSSKDIYKNPWIVVTEDVVIRPDGEKGIFGVVSMKPGISILPIEANGTIYLIREYKYAIKRETVEMVSGGIDINETPAQAAVRELQEELGMTAKQYTYVGCIDPFTNAIVSPNHMFIAQGLSSTQNSPEGTEQITIVRCSFDEAYEMVEQGEMTHAASVVLLLQAKRLGFGTAD